MADRRDAASWFAVLRRGLMTQEERAAFAAWRSEPHNARALASLQQLWDELDLARSPKGSAKNGPAVRVASLWRSARLAAALTAATIMVSVIFRLDGPWWTTLDWWSR